LVRTCANLAGIEARLSRRRARCRPTGHAVGSRDRIAKFQGQAIGEENTKHALIEPVLRALGWDVEDLDEVRCEYKLKQADNPVDYALFVHGNLRLFVEAKALGENLDKWASQRPASSTRTPTTTCTSAAPTRTGSTRATDPCGRDPTSDPIVTDWVGS
jgi:hypothetical protein